MDAALVILGAAVVALVGRTIMLREHRSAVHLCRQGSADRGLDLRDPRDLSVLVLALVLGVVSFLVLLGLKFGH